MELSAVILAGGQSRRMGCDKARLEWDGQSLLERAVANVRRLGTTDVFLSGRPDRDDSRAGCAVLHDRVPGLGPLSGIERALQAACAPHLLVLAVDLPRITVAFLKKLADACEPHIGVVPELNGRLEPLAAVYPKHSHAFLTGLLESRRLAVCGFAEVCRKAGAVRILPVSPREAGLLANCNQPADWHEALARAGLVSSIEPPGVRTILSAWGWSNP